MANKNKTFDCVEMKTQGAQKIQAEIAGMTQAEELAFWQDGTAKLQARQAQIQADRTSNDTYLDAPLAVSV